MSQCQSVRLEGWSHLSSLTLDMELQDLEFALLGFGFALVKYFLSIPRIPPSEVYVLCQCMLDVCNFLLIL